MTERAVVRFKVYNKEATALPFNVPMPFNVIDFNIGGIYDTGLYEYSVQSAGTYLIGVSYNKSGGTSSVDVQIKRIINGVLTTISINRSQMLGSYSNQTINPCFLYKLEVDDILFCLSNFGNPKTNNTAYSTNDTLNSFWGIRLDY